LKFEWEKKREDMDSVLEAQRLVHEEIERLQEAIANLIIEKTKSVSLIPTAFARILTVNNVSLVHKLLA
jgi:hypothetical protein